MKDKDQNAAAVAGDSGANDEYAVSSALSGPPPPPEIFPEELSRQQAAEQGGDDERAEPDEVEDDEVETVSVDQADKASLEAAVKDKGLTVTGTGQGGSVTAEDLRKALKSAGVDEVAKA